MNDMPWADSLFPPTCWRHGIPENECRCHPRCSICDLPWDQCRCYGEDMDAPHLTDEEFADIRRGRLVDLWEDGDRA